MKIDGEAFAEVEDVLGANEGCQTTLLQYGLITPLVSKIRWTLK